VVGLEDDDPRLETLRQTIRIHGYLVWSEINPYRKMDSLEEAARDMTAVVSAITMLEQGQIPTQNFYDERGVNPQWLSRHLWEAAREARGESMPEWDGRRIFHPHVDYWCDEAYELALDPLADKLAARLADEQKG
jgi:hypothetical protein